MKGLAQLHGGNLTIESTLGIGTTARIELPLETRLNENAPRKIVQKTVNQEASIIPFQEKLETLKKSANGQA